MDVTLTAEQQRVLTWADSRRRDLPWRSTRDPWAVLVAEVMLQQTQVDRAQPKWVAFLERFPTAKACAAAPLADVLQEWTGLGYPRRARNLHLTAIAIDQGGGTVPDTLDELLAFPGIGPYTARAVLAFAFESEAAVVDTNVGRILARRQGQKLTAAQAQVQADQWLVPGSSWAWNQGLLDLGALCCRAKEPVCVGCPVRRTCAWARSGWAAPDPASGSASVSVRQSRFEGSARQARGRLLRRTQQAPVSAAELCEVVGWAGQVDAIERAQAVADSLLHDGLIDQDSQGRLVVAG
ncbi:MAG: hypothetical protein WD029_03475, partial [Microthrixaceae bacterium]